MTHAGCPAEDEKKVGFVDVAQRLLYDFRKGWLWTGVQDGGRSLALV